MTKGSQGQATLTHCVYTHKQFVIEHMTLNVNIHLQLIENTFRFKSVAQNEDYEIRIIGYDVTNSVENSLHFGHIWASPLPTLVFTSLKHNHTVMLLILYCSHS